jgi:hypothetical protein
MSPKIKTLSYKVEILSKVSIKSLLKLLSLIDCGQYKPDINHFLLLRRISIMMDSIVLHPVAGQVGSYINNQSAAMCVSVGSTKVIVVNFKLCVWEGVINFGFSNDEHINCVGC